MEGGKVIKNMKGMKKMKKMKEMKGVSSVMKKINIYAVLFAAIIAIAVLPTNSAFADTGGTVRHVMWNKDFINLQIPIGKEKIIEFCAPGSVTGCKTIGFMPYIPETLLQSGSLKYLGANGALYLTATKPFSNKLMQVSLQNSRGDTVFIRLSATYGASTDRIEILLSQQSQSNSSNQNASTDNHNKMNQGQLMPGQTKEDSSIGDMVRWVAQQLYAPKRLLTQPNWIYRVPMHTDRFVALYQGGVVSSMPLASWQAGNYYITAVLIRNVLQDQQVVLTQNMLRGHWIASSFFRLSPLNPAVLTPAQTITDSTTAILVSTVPFDAALNEGGNNV